MSDLDFALALRASFDEEDARKSQIGRPGALSVPPDVSIVDEYWEYADPNPDIRALFLLFNDRFFKGKLAGCEVKWSPRMTLCAGLCSYEGYGGLCSIRLSQPLLKLRPRKDLVETLLHEMIHAYLFVTQNNKDHDGHGPEFQSHMHRINAETGSHITIYHSFHNEVRSCRQHWWRCNGPCRHRPPRYGMLRRAMNRTPSSKDFWWAEHQKTCGGTYEKVKEPDGYKGKGKKRAGKEDSTAAKRDKQKTITDFVSSSSSDGSSRLQGVVKTGRAVKESSSVGEEKSIGAYFSKLGKGAVLGHKNDSCPSASGTAKSPLVINDSDSDFEETKERSTMAESSQQSAKCFVFCPVCNKRLSEDVVNSHLDACLCNT